jgi:hypothetical protein
MTQNIKLEIGIWDSIEFIEGAIQDDAREETVEQLMDLFNEYKVLRTAQALAVLVAAYVEEVDELYHSEYAHQRLLNFMANIAAINEG